MLASTVVTRTAAGSAELAAPTHGLSLAQRRFLTLLDTTCSVEELASRQRADPAKVERDLARLASLGLVMCEAPAANDDEAVIAANDDDVAAARAQPPAGERPASFVAVRLGAPGTSSRLPFVLVPLAAVAALVAWYVLSSPRAPVPAPAVASSPSTQAPLQDAPATAEAIATKVLVGDPTPTRAPESAKEPPKTKPTGESAVGATSVAAKSAPAAPSPLPMLRPIETRLAAPEPFVAVPLALPVERRSPPSAAPILAAPTPKSEPHEAAPVHVASAAPPATAVAPARTLVPVAQEPPTFPREAIAAGLASGSVKARLVVDAKGGVGSVEIVDTSHRAFDRAVREALSHWRFEPGNAGRTTTVDIAFKRD
jgi:TonB family protein